MIRYHSTLLLFGRFWPLLQSISPSHVYIKLLYHFFCLFHCVYSFVLIFTNLSVLIDYHYQPNNKLCVVLAISFSLPCLFIVIPVQRSVRYFYRILSKIPIINEPYPLLPLITYLGNDISSLRSHSPFIPSSYLVLYPLTSLLPYFFVYYVLICHLRGSHDRRYVTRSSSHLGVISVPLLYRRLVGSLFGYFVLWLVTHYNTSLRSATWPSFSAVFWHVSIY